MRNRGVRLVVVAVMLLVQWGMAIELELSAENSLEVCMTLISSFDPINVELRFPPVSNKQPQESFGIRLAKVTTPMDQKYVEMGDNFTYRYSYDLESNVPYNLCVTFNAIRGMDSINPLYVGYSAIEDFQHLIGQVQIPKELASQENLKAIYHIAGELKQVSSVIKGHQLKERKIEDDIVTRNIHKEKRIILLGLIEVLIILLCGVYQVFALRRVLIDKNLY